MSNKGANLRDIIIGVILLLIGGITLLHNFGVISLNESVIVLWVSYGLAGLGVLLLLFYFFKPSSIWLFILSLCSFFLATIIYISNFLPGQEDLIGVTLFLLLAVGFLAYFVVKPSQWWSLFVGWVCIGLGGTIYATTSVVQVPILRNMPSDVLAPTFLFTSITLGFLFVWLLKPRTRWWALLTAGMIAAVESVILMEYWGTADTLKPVVMFLVAGVVFLLVWLLRNEDVKLGWAIYPALVLISFSAFLYLVTFWQNNSRLVISLIFIFIGLFFVLNYIRMRAYSKTSYKQRGSSAMSASPAKQVYERERDVSDEDFWKEDKKEAKEAEKSEHASTSTEEREALMSESEEEAEEAPEKTARPDEIRPPVDYPIETEEKSGDEEDTDEDKNK